MEHLHQSSGVAIMRWVCGVGRPDEQLVPAESSPHLEVRLSDFIKPWT